MNTIKICDDFDLHKISRSGQCFRVREFDDGLFRFVTGGHVLYIEGDAGEYKISCSTAEWQNVWVPYFDFDREYAEIRAAIPKSDVFLRDASERGAGIRILRQEPWETLCSFIISQRKNIPAIQLCIEKLCGSCGEKVQTPYETLFLFPTQAQILERGDESLCRCSLGYRQPYVLDAARRTCGGTELSKAVIDKMENVFRKESCPEGEINLDDMATFPDDALIEGLMKIKGVGIKVASCVALFAYGRTEHAPVDVWIDRMIKLHYEGENPFPAYGNAAGIMQQYMYFAAIEKT